MNLPARMKSVSLGEERLRILWWGRSDRRYSRNSIILNHLEEMEVQVRFHHPAVSSMGWLEAYFRKLSKPHLIWVPSFRQRDIRSASLWAKKWGVPLVFDPLISSYQKKVFEKQKYPPGSRWAERARRKEESLFHRADTVISDTPAHKDFFVDHFHLKPDMVHVLYVGAESKLFHPAPYPEPSSPFRVLFYGSFLPFQGTHVIVEAIKLCENLPIHWTIIGTGPTSSDFDRAIEGRENVTRMAWVPYEDLAQIIARSHVLLGAFGAGMKGDLVIPNKVFQGMAVGRPIITRIARAYDATLSGSDVMGWVEPEDPKGLAELLRKWISKPDELAIRAEQTRSLYERHFSEAKLREDLWTIIQSTLHSGN